MQSQVQKNPKRVPQLIARGCLQLAFFAALWCLVGFAAGTPNALWAQAPESQVDPEPAVADPPAPLETVDPEDNIPPEFITFSAMLNPGADIWLISGQIGGCEDPSDIGVSIGGVVSASAVTDVFGYFEVVVSYEGIRDTITADADYEGLPLPQASTQIGG